jgi:nitroimidazol reductase NimA-like FMN-containing flavoprotein (pyridoxamine 5'-phosphate oxidase superfamily)
MKNRVLTFKDELEGIIRKCQFCNVAMVDEINKPYVIPMNFGFEDGFVYLHGSATGRKNDILSLHPDVCISFSTDHELRYVNEDVACSWSMRYRSVLVHGKVEFLKDLEEKTRALSIIMSHYTRREFTYSAPALRDVQVYKVVIEMMEGRAYGY